MRFCLIVDSVSSGFFTPCTYSDFTRVDWGAKKCNIKATFDYCLLLPKDSSYVPLISALCMAYDGVNSVSALTKKLKEEAVAYFADFRTNIITNDFRNSISEEDKNRMCSQGGLGLYDNKSLTSYIEYLSEKLISVKVKNYEYSGGSNCCWSDNYYSYSTKENRIVHLNDVINLKDSIIIKKRYTKRLTAMGFGEFYACEEARIHMSDYYYFTPTGINFITEFASIRDLQVFIPFSEFGPALRKQSWME